MACICVGSGEMQPVRGAATSEEIEAAKKIQRFVQQWLGQRSVVASRVAALNTKMERIRIAAKAVGWHTGLTDACADLLLAKEQPPFAGLIASPPDFAEYDIASAFIALELLSDDFRVIKKEWFTDLDRFNAIQHEALDWGRMIEQPDELRSLAGRLIVGYEALKVLLEEQQEQLTRGHYGDQVGREFDRLITSSFERAMALVPRTLDALETLLIWQEHGKDSPQEKMAAELAFAQRHFEGQESLGGYIDLRAKFRKVLRFDRKRAGKIKERVQTEGDSSYGAAHLQGKRPTMEDVHFFQEIELHGTSGKLAVLCDGHGDKGRWGAHIKDQLGAVIPRALVGLDDDQIYNGLRRIFLALDGDRVSAGGTTVIGHLLVDERVFTFCVGDSRAIYCPLEGEAQQLSEDAIPSTWRFRRELLKAGQAIRPRKGGTTLRVNGDLAVARDVGNMIVSSEPGITCIARQPGYLVLACDGVWDVMTSAEANTAVQAMAEAKMSPEEMAGRLTHNAFVRGSSDNISVVVVSLF